MGLLSRMNSAHLSLPVNSSADLVFSSAAVYVYSLSIQSTSFCGSSVLRAYLPKFVGHCETISMNEKPLCCNARFIAATHCAGRDVVQRSTCVAPAPIASLTLSLIHISEPTRLGMISY